MTRYPRTGKYKVQNKQKYVADLNECTWRSSWELVYMKYLDKQPNVIEWASESVIIPYYNPAEKKSRRYFVDFYVKVLAKTGKYQKYIVEIKPAEQCKPPKKKKRLTQKYKNELKAYVRNMSKFKAAKKWAEKRGWIFIIVTEKELGII